MNNNTNIDTAFDKRYTQEMIIQLVKMASENSKKPDLFYKLSSSMIWSGLAEYLANSILQIVEQKINEVTLEKGLGIDMESKYKKKRPSNLEYVMDQLKNYKFDSKAEIISLLGNIKKSRNNLFHNFLNAREKGINMDQEMKDIENNAEKLFLLCKSWNGACIVCGCKD